MRPEDNDGKQRDPFSVFAEIGAVFPQGDGDDYASLCRRAKPDHIPEINRLFAEGEPSFDMVDALDQGGSWPKLKTLLGANSPKEILLGILSPQPEAGRRTQDRSDLGGGGQGVCSAQPGPRLKTRGQTRQSIADELWRVVLFSEFVFDSGGDDSGRTRNRPQGRAGGEESGL